MIIRKMIRNIRKEYNSTNNYMKDKRRKVKN